MLVAFIINVAYTASSSSSSSSPSSLSPNSSAAACLTNELTPTNDLFRLFRSEQATSS